VSYTDGHYFLHWFFIDVLWKITVGILAGSLVGYLTAKIILKPAREMAVRDGFIAIALAFLAYGGTQLVHGYGFLGVFIAAHVFRHYEHDHKFHNTLYNFSDQIERLITPMLLVLMAVFIYQGVLSHLTWQEIILAIIFLLIIRPISGLIGLMSSKTTLYNKLIISIFGIRGIGSFYYLAYALNQTNYFNQYGQQLWRIAILIVLISIILHGMSASIVFQRLTLSRK
jgi:NhaP-type Na+/H+ or K+/H+ antiporter